MKISPKLAAFKSRLPKLVRSIRRLLIVIIGVLAVLLISFVIWWIFFKPESPKVDITTELMNARASTEDNMLPLDTALDLFASIYGDIPGGKARFDKTRPYDGSLTLRALGNHWDELSDAQKQAIQEHVRSNPDDSSSLKDLVAPTVHAQEGDLQQTAEQIAQGFASELESPLEHPMEVVSVPQATWDDNTIADAAPFRGNRMVWQGDYDRCRIRISEDLTDVKAVIAHEVFHCYQYEMAPLDVYVQVQDWVTEGSADWGAATLVGSDAVITGHFVNWMQNGASLYNMDYPAVGYFWTIETMEIDPWQDIPRIISAGLRGDGAHNAQLEHKNLALRLGTGAFMSSADQTDVDKIWDLAPSAVPREFRQGRIVSEDSPIDISGNGPSFSKTRAQQANVAGDALDIELRGEIGAVQEIGGELQTFEGYFRDRICFSKDSARIVFLAVSQANPGPIDIKLSVPDDKDVDANDCRPSCSGVEGSHVRIAGPEIYEIDRTTKDATGNYPVIATGRYEPDILVPIPQGMSVGGTVTNPCPGEQKLSEAKHAAWAQLNFGRTYKGVGLGFSVTVSSKNRIIQASDFNLPHQCKPETVVYTCQSSLKNIQDGYIATYRSLRYCFEAPDPHRNNQKIEYKYSHPLKDGAERTRLAWWFQSAAGARSFKLLSNLSGSDRYVTVQTGSNFSHTRNDDHYDEYEREANNASCDPIDAGLESELAEQFTSAISNVISGTRQE